MIIADKLTKTFSDKKRGVVHAVEAVSFQCNPGEIYGLLGVNGAGKTTTLRMLATILRPSLGTAQVAGFDVVTQPDKVRSNIGFLSTATALYGRLTARETIEYFGRLNGMKGEMLQKRVNDLMQLLEITQYANGRCDKLSTGMKQKVSIARTIVHDPQVMIFDEPTLGLDVLAARGIVSFIKSCRESGKTVIFSSHVMSEVEKLCDRVGIIHGGHLLTEGKVSELKKRHGKEYLEDIFVELVEREHAHR
ncbi:MAG: ATP-binding cassette domain-containing protein [Verrucomicrobiales bacterium]